MVLHFIHLLILAGWGSIGKKELANTCCFLRTLCLPSLSSRCFTFNVMITCFSKIDLLTAFKQDSLCMSFGSAITVINLKLFIYLFNFQN